MNPRIRKTRSSLKHILSGYEGIEPCIITALALKQNVFLVGPHGNGKTTLARTLARVVDKSGRGWRIYHADKADLITIGGLPNLEKWGTSGEPSFLASRNAIWGAKVIVVDELPRADKTKQNYWLEIAEDRTFQGIPIDYEMLLATGNDATYHGNFKFDLALLSRFMFVLPAPRFDEIISEDVIEMIRLNQTNGRDIEQLSNDLKELTENIQKRVEAYRQNKDVMEQIQTFAGTFVQFIKDKIRTDVDLANNPDAYTCPREFAVHFINAILGLGAYYEEQGYKDKFIAAGQDAVKYVFETRHASAGDKYVNITKAAFKQLSNMLVDGVDSPAGKLRWHFASAISAPQKMAFWRKYLPEAVNLWQPDELTTMAGDTLQQIRNEAIGQVGPFWYIMKQEPKVAHIGQQIEGFMITEVARRLLTGYADPASKEAQLYHKFKDTPVLKPQDVAEIIGG